jgi:hypothetical protein
MPRKRNDSSLLPGAGPKPVTKEIEDSLGQCSESNLSVMVAEKLSDQTPKKFEAL